MGNAMDVHISYGIADKLLTLAAVLFQLAVLALIAYGVSYVVDRLFRLERTKRTLGKVFVPCLAAVFLSLAVWVQNPIVSCPAELQLRFTPEMRQEAVALQKGFVYFPFFTAKITVKDIQEDGVVTIESLYLFVLARDEVAFGGPDGPEVVEKLNLIW